MKKKGSNGLIQIFLSFGILVLVPNFIQIFLKKYYKDSYIICIMLSILIMVDAKMKYDDSKLVKLNYWLLIILFSVNFIFLLI